MDPAQDANGLAQAALARVVQGFGVPVLGQADLLEGLLNDDVPQLTRQIAMLTEAARSGMAELLAERMKQGISTQAAVSMVAADVTSRSAMDTAGAHWAATAFAAALGYEVVSVPEPTSVPQATPGEPDQAAPPTYVVNRGGPVLPDPGQAPGSQETIRPGAAQPWMTSPDVPQAEQATQAGQVPQVVSPGQQWPGAAPPQQPYPVQGPQPQWPQQQAQPQQAQPQQAQPQQPPWQGPGQQWPQNPQQGWTPAAPAWQTGPQWAQQATGPAWPLGPGGAPLAPIATGVAVCAALATGLSALLQLFWAGIHRTSSGEAVFWFSTLVVIIAAIVIAIWTAQDRRTGAGLAATIGIALPAVSWNIYEAAFAGNVTASETERHELLGVSVIALLAALVAALIAIAALASRRQLGRQKADPISVILVIIGILYPLTNIVAQEKFENFEFGNVLGSGVRGYYILWGILFLVLFALPPVLSVFFSPGSRAQLGVWIGWLLLVLGWQISDSPVDGEKAAAGLVLSWLTWVVVLIFTLVLAARGPRAQLTAGAGPQAPVAGSPWPGSPA